MNQLEKVINFASKAHEGQTYGDKPYTYHLLQVYNNVKELWPDSSFDVLAAAWLHDTLEDTPTGVDAITEAFGPHVAYLVGLLTDKPGANRKERHRNTYPLIAQSEEATRIKLSDRLANIREASLSKSNLLAMYRKEHSYFKEVFYQDAYKKIFDIMDEYLK